MTRTMSLSAGIALCFCALALAVIGWTEAIPGDKSRTNTLSLNGLHLNGADLRALTGDGGPLRATAGRLAPAAE
jgi:hypothetical protein